MTPRLAARARAAVQRRLVDPVIDWRNARHGGRKTIHLHVGVHKAGSTLIQSLLKCESRRLRWHGFYHDRAFYRLGKTLKRGSPLPPDQLQRLRTEFDDRLRARPEPNIIGSSEGLFGSLFESYTNIRVVAEDLRAILDGFDVRIVACIRRQDEFVQSVYNQHVKDGGTLTFDAFVRTHDIHAFRWHDLLQEYADVFGRTNLRVRCYEDLAREPSRALETVFEPLAASGFRARCRPGVVNPGLSPKGLEIAVRCNELLTPEERALLRRFLQKTFIRLPGEPFSLFTPEQRRQLLESYAESNRACFEEFLGGSSHAGRYLPGGQPCAMQEAHVR
jgi:hypothetical protein